jgi:membrane-associated phospholipid phosphatase
MHLSSAPVTARQYKVNLLIWAGFLAFAIIDAIWIYAAGITIDLSGFMPLFINLSLCAMLCFFYGYIRKDANLWLAGQILAQMLLSSPILGGFSYLGARLALPLLDEQLIAIDKLMFFDWRSYIAWVNSMPWLADILSIAYDYAIVYMVLIFVLLFLLRNLLHLQCFATAYLVTGLVTIILSSLLPAVAGYIHYDIDISQYPNLHPAAERDHEEVYFGMRNHTLNVFALPLKGIVTFPSFHATVAVLLVYASWPVAILRYLSMLLTFLVLMSTPVDGGHYLIDVVGGMIIAFAGIWLVEKTIKRPSLQQRLATAAAAP